MNSSKFYTLKENEYFLKKKKRKKIKKIFLRNHYWDFINHRDPDDKKKNLVNEKKKKLNDLKSEIKFIKKKAKNIKKPRIIDLGSGFGFFLSTFGKNWEKHGVEISVQASKNSKKWSEIHNIDIEKKLEPKITSKLKKFDFIFSYHVIEHLSNPKIFIENCHKLLKTNGYLIIGTPNFDSACSRRFGKNYRFYKDKTHISFFSEISLYRLLDDSGFKVLNVDFPFFETEHFKKKNLIRLIDKKKTSPPFYGNVMTFYCTKKSIKEIKASLKFKKNNINKIIKLLSEK